MKGIIVKDCLDCPYSDIKNPENDGGILICEIGKSFSGGMKLIDRMVLYGSKIPDWCQLDDLQDVVDSAALEHYIRYRKKEIVKSYERF